MLKLQNLLPGAFVLAGCVLACAPARAQQSATEAVKGKWALVSVYEEDDGGEDLDRWGNQPEGRFTADNGSFTFLLVGKNITHIASTKAERACSQLHACRETLEEKVIGYAGEYAAGRTADELVLHVQDALEKNWDGRKLTASIRIEGNRLHFISASEPSPTGTFYVHLVWKRVE